MSLLCNIRFISWDLLSSYIWFCVFGGILINLLNCISILLKNYIIILWLLHAALQRFSRLIFMNIVINLKQMMVVKSRENSQFFWLIAVVIVSVYGTEHKGSLCVKFREPFQNKKLWALASISWQNSNLCFLLEIVLFALSAELLNVMA